MQLKTAQIFVDGRLRRSTQKLGKLASGSKVRFSRPGHEFAHAHILNHALAQWGSAWCRCFHGCAPVVNEANCLNSQLRHTYIADLPIPLIEGYRASGLVQVDQAAVPAHVGRELAPLSFTPQRKCKSLTPVREAVERVAVKQPDLRDCFLCHAWPDRQGAAKDLDDALKAAGVKTWFSELDLGLGVPMMRTIDRGLANSRIGLVLVTPNFIKGLPNQGVADKELSALLAGNRLVPIVHETTYDELRNVSPLLASRTGLDTKEDTMVQVAEKIAELVKIWT
jgi:hypothetical protein